MQLKAPEELGRRRSTSSVSLGFTLNPNDKFLIPAPPKAFSHLRRTSSTSSVIDVFKRRKAGLLQEFSAVSPKTSLDEAKSHKLRPSISVPALQPINSLKPAACSESNLRWQATWTSSGPVEEANSVDCLDSRPGSSHGRQSIVEHFHDTSQLSASARLGTSIEASTAGSQWVRRRSDLHITLPDDGATERSELIAEDGSLLMKMSARVAELRIDTAVSTSAQNQDEKHLQLPGHDITLMAEIIGPAEMPFQSNEPDEKLQHRSSVFSYAPSSCFSPSMESTVFSGSHLSQPETPIMSDFGEEFLGTFETFELSFGKDNADTTPRGDKLNVYSLPAVEYASALTLPNAASAASKATCSDPSFGPKSGNQLVESWNDGSEHRKSALDDLFDDLSYLKAVIV